MDDQVLLQIVQAVNAILDPNTPHNDRQTAHSICESYKNNDMSCLIGYTLVSNHDMASHVKQFGLQLMQHFVRNQWINAAQEIQIQTKNNAMQLMKDCPNTESGYVKDGIAHVLAEIVKHVWPQQWPTMVQEMVAIAGQGAVQTELVELVFLRIAEDVAVLQNISVSHRSQDIRQGLSISMTELMEFFMSVLETNSMKYVNLFGSGNQLEELSMYRELSVTTLKTLQGFLEWTSTEHIFAKDGAYILLLCRLLEVEGLKVPAVECLTLAMHRKGQEADRKRILTLTTPMYVEGIVSAIKKAANSPAANEEQYLFLKRMGEFLSSLAGQVVASWASEEEATESQGKISNLASHIVFLDLLLFFLQQSNPVLADTVTMSWYSMFQHRGMAKDETLRRYVPMLLQIVGTGLQNCSNVDLPVHAQLDFNDADEIQLFIALHRKNLLQIVRGCTATLPNECLTIGLEWLGAELRGVINTGKDELGVKLEHCNYKSPSYIQWDTIRSIIDITIRTGITHAKRQNVIESTPISAAENLLNEILRFQTLDVLLCQCQISFIGAFLPMLDVFVHSKDIVRDIIQKFSNLLRYSVTHPENRSTFVSLLKRHCLSAIVHLCKYHPASVVQVYDDFKQIMGELVSILGDLDKITIYESLVLVSGEWKNYEQQSALIGEAMLYAADMWLPKDDVRIQTPRDFAAAIGLCSPGASYFDEPAGPFRGNLSLCVTLTLAMVNRSRVPEDRDSLQNGGFFDANGNILHPCAKHVLLVLERIATLTENFHALWTSPVISTIHKDFIKSLNIRDSERRTMITFNPVTKDPELSVEKAPWERMQNFILLNLENCYQILGGVGKCCNVLLYGNPDLLSVLLKKSFSDITVLPELRIRSFTRQFLYYFLKSCPGPYFCSVAAPILNRYCEFMNQVLQKKWNEYASKERARLKVVAESFSDMRQDYDDNKEEDEVLEEQLLRIVSREYLDLLVNLCVNKRPNPKNGAKADENIDCNTEMQDESMPTQSSGNSIQLTPLGLSLVQTELAETLLATALVSLSWHDTTTAFKGVQLSWPLLKHTFSATPFIPGDAAKFIFESLLLGLQRQGQHEGCAAQLTALSLYAYVSLRPTHGSLLETLRAIPQINHRALEAFDKDFAKYAEKRRKTAFKKLVSGVIEQHIGQRFKCRQDMRRLPKFFQGRRPNSLVDIDVESLGLEMFFKPD